MLNCPSGYTEINGSCQWMYQQGDANLDGTPNTGGDQGGNFWSKVGNAVEQYGPLILVGAGTFWQSQQNKNQPTTPAGTPPPPPQPQKAGFPTWGYFAIGAAVLLIVVLLIRKK